MRKHPYSKKEDHTNVVGKVVFFFTERPGSAVSLDHLCLKEINCSMPTGGQMLPEK